MSNYIPHNTVDAISDPCLEPMYLYQQKWSHFDRFISQVSSIIECTTYYSAIINDIKRPLVMNCVVCMDTKFDLHTRIVFYRLDALIIFLVYSNKTQHIYHCLTHAHEWSVWSTFDNTSLMSTTCWPVNDFGNCCLCKFVHSCTCIVVKYKNINFGNIKIKTFKEWHHPRPTVIRKCEH